jgi:hypothetical protein
MTLSEPSLSVTLVPSIFASGASWVAALVSDAHDGASGIVLRRRLRRGRGAVKAPGAALRPRRASAAADVLGPFGVCL